MLPCGESLLGNEARTEHRGTGPGVRTSQVLNASLEHLDPAMADLPRNLAITQANEFSFPLKPVRDETKTVLINNTVSRRGARGGDHLL